MRPKIKLLHLFVPYTCPLMSFFSNNVIGKDEDEKPSASPLVNPDLKVVEEVFEDWDTAGHFIYWISLNQHSYWIIFFVECYKGKVSLTNYRIEVFVLSMGIGAIAALLSFIILRLLRHWKQR